LIAKSEDFEVATYIEGWEVLGGNKLQAFPLASLVTAGSPTDRLDSAQVRTHAGPLTAGSNGAGEPVPITALCIIDDSSLRDTKKMKVDPNVGLGLIACTCTLFFRGNTIQKTGYSSDLYNSLQQPQ
jgi:hypothetical protein